MTPYDRGPHGEPKPSGVNEESVGVWVILRPFIAFAAALLLLALPPSNRVAQAALAVAGVALLVCAFPGRGSAAAQTSSSPWWGRVLLVCGGSLAILGPFLYSNPTPWNVGSQQWPWTTWLEGPRWQPRLDVLAIVVAGVVAIFAGVRSRSRALAAAALVLAALATIRGYATKPQGGHGPLDFSSLGRVNLPWAICAAALGGALIHLASASSARRGLARAIVVAAVLGIVSVYVTWFPESGAGRHSSVAYYSREIHILLGVITRGTEADPDTTEGIRQQFIAVGVPFLCQALALVLALLVAAAPSRTRARPVRWLALVAWLVLLATWILPSRAGVWFQNKSVVDAMGEAVMKAGLAIWLVACGAVASLLGTPASVETAAAAPPLRPSQERSASRLTAVLYFLAAAAALLALRACFDPVQGVPGTRSVREVARSGTWNAEFASLAFQASFALLMLVVAFATFLSERSRVRGAVAAVASGIAIAALAPTREATKWFTGIEWYVAPALGVLAAGLSIPGSRENEFGRRAAAISASLLLLVLLVYPDFVDSQRGSGARASEITMPFHTKLLSETLGRLASAPTSQASVRVLGSEGLMTLCLAATALLAMGAAALRSRVLAAFAAITMLGGAILGHSLLVAIGASGLGPSMSNPSLLVAAIYAAQGSEGGLLGLVDATVQIALEFLPSLLWRLGTNFLAYAVPSLLGLYAALLDLRRGSEATPSAP